MIETMRFTVPALLFLLLTAATLQAQEQLKPEDLTSAHRIWLEQEVRHIITSQERDAFLSIAGADLRGQFIERFWELRDPTPGTKKNEFKEEHYRRLEYVNRYFGNRSAKTGWRTDRGRFYILLGEPETRSQFPSNSQVYPLELWFYQVKSSLTGGTSFFYLIFFQRHGAGVYELYRPGVDSPADLTWTTGGNPLDALRELDVELAMAATGYDPLSRGNALASELLLARIERIPENTIDTSWAADFVNSRGTVTVDYRFLPADIPVTTLLHTSAASGQALHYAFSLSPDLVDAGKSAEGYYSAIAVIASLANSKGTLVHEQERVIELNWSAEEFAAISRQPLQFSDVLPVIPGDFTFTLRITNRVSKTGFLVSQEVSIPDPLQGSSALTPPSLHTSFVQGQASSVISPFSLERVTLTPVCLNTFSSRQPVIAFCEAIYAVQPDMTGPAGPVTFEFAIIRDSNIVRSSKRTVIPSDPTTPVIYTAEKIDLQGLDTGDYRLKISASHDATGWNASRSLVFSVVTEEEQPRPAHHEMPGSSLTISGAAVARARQYQRLNDLNQAVVHYQLALADDAAHLSAALEYGRLVLNKGGNPERAAEIAQRALQTHPENTELLHLLALCAEAGEDWTVAVGYYERMLLSEPENLTAINGSAHAAARAGNTGLALRRLRQSLEINPDQEAARSLLDSLQ